MSNIASTTPESASALLQQASEQHRQGRLAESAAAFHAALAQAPGPAQAWDEYGYVLKALGHDQEAVDAFGQALALGIARPHEAHLNRAVLYADRLRRDDQARTELEAALAIEPGYVPALMNLGNLHEQRGERDLALACYQRVLEASDVPAGPHSELRGVALARCAVMQPPATLDDPRLAQLQQAASAAGNNAMRANIWFAVGHSFDRLAASDQAFDAYAKANRCLLRQSGRCYDREHASALTDAMMAAFPAASVTTDSDSATGEPLFICGMFRSGSTLVEQILASHPQVVGGGELDWLLRVAAERLAPFPASVATLSAAQERGLASEYQAHLLRLFPAATQARYISDKRPDNFQLIGFIKRLFPAARIVHTLRHPLDNGLSIYMQNLNLEVAGYASDLGDIGHRYGEYRRLMAHWKHLYPDTMLDFDYDQFVRQPEPAIARLLDFLGLEWDPRCLQFHTLRNTVKTASYWQVRRPLYAEASGRWQRYRQHLGPLVQALAAAGIYVDA